MQKGSDYEIFTNPIDVATDLPGFGDAMSIAPRVNSVIHMALAGADDLHDS
jgi:hypothetical protein